MRARLLLVCVLGCGETTPEAPAPAPLGAKDIATARRHTRLVFEIDAVTGRGPNTAALDDLRARLDSLVASGHLGKPGGIELRVDETNLPAMGAGHAYSLDALTALATKHRSVAAKAGEAMIHMLYVDGKFAGQEGVLGFALGSELVVMFREVIDGSCNALLPAIRAQVCRLAEAGVLIHEVGHTMGLVNNGVSMVTPHQDVDHGAHDANKDCVMYWQAEQASAVDLVAARVRGGSASPAEFDAACLADLKAAQME